MIVEDIKYFNAYAIIFPEVLEERLSWVMVRVLSILGARWMSSPAVLTKQDTHPSNTETWKVITLYRQAIILSEGESEFQ